MGCHLKVKCLRRVVLKMSEDVETMTLVYLRHSVAKFRSFESTAWFGENFIYMITTMCVRDS